MANEDATSGEEQTTSERVVDPKDIALDNEWNPDYPGYWDHHGRSKEEYLDYVGSGEADGAAPPKVTQVGDHYVLNSDGSHRVAASQELNRPITVDVVPGNAATEDEEQEMSL